MNEASAKVASLLGVHLITTSMQVFRQKMHLASCKTTSQRNFSKRVNSLGPHVLLRDSTQSNHLVLLLIGLLGQYIVRVVIDVSVAISALFMSATSHALRAKA
jgi:hypothetical protein